MRDPLLEPGSVLVVWLDLPLSIVTFLVLGAALSASVLLVWRMCRALRTPAKAAEVVPLPAPPESREAA